MRRLGSLVAIIFGVVAPSSAQAPPRNPLVGAWRIVEVTMVDSTTRTDFTQSQYTFTERHYSAEFSVGRKPWTVGRGAPPPTDSAIVDVWKNMVASSGSYDRTDSTYTTHPVVGKDPQANYGGRTLAYRLRGDTLFLTASGSTPSMGIRRIRLVRVE